MNWKRILLFTFLGLALLGAGWLANLIWFRPFNIHHFYSRTFLQFALNDPELLTQLRILEPMGIKYHNKRWTDATPLHEINQLMRLKESVQTLAAYDIERLSPSEQISYQTMHQFLQGQVDGEPFLFHSYPINQLQGFHLHLPDLLTQSHQIHTRQDAEHYLERLRFTDVKMNQVLENLRFREEMKGVVPPRIIVQRVQEQVRAFLKKPLRKNPIYLDLVEKLDALPEVEDRIKQGIRRHSIRQFQWRVYPAYRRLNEYLTHLDTIASDTIGVWRLPDGEAYYAHQLQQMTTTNLSAEEIHQIGLNEVARITEDMQAILVAEGYPPSVEVGPTMAELAQDSIWQYPNTDSGRTACLAEYRRLITEIQQRIPEAFAYQSSPPAVESVPAYKAAQTPAAYYSPGALDGSLPGTFYANLHDMRDIPTFGMKTLTYHEAVPGHHYQFEVQKSSKELPFVMQILPNVAFAEGWALYAEQLAWEMGLYEGDPYGNLGRLQADLWRAVRLVVDTGIHHKRWTYDQAIEYMYQTTGLPKGDVIIEVERYIVAPGQACAYKIGQLKMLALRDYAKDAVGEAFDLKEFHSVVLGSGSLPLNLLEEVVENWVSSQTHHANSGT
ncbi:MAG: DUF885 domain-containing protein [Bacteroidota bacterium]